MLKELDPAQLYDACQRRLQLGWLGPASGLQRTIPQQQGEQPGYTLIGHFNLIHSHPVQVLGHLALAYLNNLKPNALNDALERLCAPPTAAILIADGQSPPPALAGMANEQGIALLGSPYSSERLILELGHYLGEQLAESQVMHGVFMEVMGIGVLLQGESGTGKSELALELINRGQRLIADDAPIFRRLDPNTLVGHCPPVLQDYLEVRGLGLLNIRAMFGDSAVKQQMPLHLIVRLETSSPGTDGQPDRLYGSRQQVHALGVAISGVTPPRGARAQSGRAGRGGSTLSYPVH
jgi:HPr kinase/phosphorylase